MARRKNIWEQIQESTEGPTVTVTIPREFAEELLRSLAASLEQDMPDDGDGEDLDSVGDLDFGDEGGDMGMDDLQGPPEDGMDIDFMPAGDDDEEDDSSGPPAGKKGPGRPPGAKNKKKSDDGDDDDKDDKEEDDDEKDESAGAIRPQTALGESAFSRLSRSLARRPVIRKRR